jgi:hypothetical protein
MPDIKALLAVLLLTACATTGSTFRSGVGDRQLEHPPYYAGVTATVDSSRLARYPVLYQRGASQAAMFDPSDASESAVAQLLREMNAFVDSILGGKALSAASGRGIVPPNVYFGCERDATDDCVERGDSALGRQGTTMRLAVERPSPEWIARHAALLDSGNASHALLVTLEVGQYWTRQSGLRGSKSVELGSGYVVPVPWLTSLETPVSVLQLTGALIDREGKAIRIGAEGLLAQRTQFVASAAGAQRLMSDADVSQVRTERRPDRPGQPLVWREALCQLVAELTTGSCR